MESKLPKVEALSRSVEAAYREAQRLAHEPGGTPEWPSEAIAEADELANALHEAYQRARKLYALTPSEHNLAGVTR